jgi:hypothetical protein
MASQIHPTVSPPCACGRSHASDDARRDVEDPIREMRTTSMRDSLRTAFASFAQEIRAEISEHEEHVADAKRRLDRVLNLLAAVDAPATPETKQ